MIYYKKDILKELRTAGFNTTFLRNKKLLSESAIQNIRQGKMVGMNSLNKLCNLLETQPAELIEWEKDK